MESHERKKKKRKAVRDDSYKGKEWEYDGKERLKEKINTNVAIA